MMKRIGLFAFSTLFAFALIGCSKDKGATSTAEPGGRTTSTTGTTGSTEPETPKVSEIPEEVKTDAFRYLGLDVTTEQAYSFAQLPNQAPQQGTQRIVYKGMEDGSPTFTIERTGALATLGNEDVAAKADGVYTLTSQLGKLAKPILTLPAKLEVGAAWQSNYELEGADGSPIKFASSSKVERQEQVQVLAGKYDAILVSMKATVEMGKQKATVNGKSWYAAGVGTVKLELSGKSGDGKPINAIIELVKPAKE